MKCTVLLLSSVRLRNVNMKWLEWYTADVVGVMLIASILTAFVVVITKIIITLGSI